MPIARHGVMAEQRTARYKTSKERLPARAAACRPRFRRRRGRPPSPKRSHAWRALRRRWRNSWRSRPRQPDCLLFYRMGDFYELFFEDAVAAAAGARHRADQARQASGRGHPHVRRADPSRRRVSAAADPAGLPRRRVRAAGGPGRRPGSAAPRPWCAATWCASSRPAR